jgi:hypothetical protein
LKSNWTTGRHLRLGYSVEMIAQLLRLNNSITINFNNTITNTNVQLNDDDDDDDDGDNNNNI